MRLRLLCILIAYYAIAVNASIIINNNTGENLTVKMDDTSFVVNKRSSKKIQFTEEQNCIGRLFSCFKKEKHLDNLYFFSSGSMANYLPVKVDKKVSTIT